MTEPSSDEFAQMAAVSKTITISFTVSNYVPVAVDRLLLGLTFIDAKRDQNSLELPFLYCQSKVTSSLRQTS